MTTAAQVKIFISHSSEDNGFVRDLRQELARHGRDGWIDSRELRGGDPLWSTIQGAIEAAAAFVVVVSRESLQSRWVARELKHAVSVREKDETGVYRVIVLLLDGTKLGLVEAVIGEEPTYISATSDAGGVQAAMDGLLAALGDRLPADIAPEKQPPPQPLEELVLELNDLKFHEKDGVRRASARARLVYEPADRQRPHVHSRQSWRFIAPIGPIEADELRWYLEKYAVWPSSYFADRAAKVAGSLIEWGRLLHDAAVPPAHVANVTKAWAGIDAAAGRRFSVEVDADVEAGASVENIAAAREAATSLLGLPWELLHDGDGFLFQGAKPTRVRRRLPGTRDQDVPVVATPVRILLISARPEDEACSYLDHRVSALPLVQAMEALGGLVRIRVLGPPTLPALRQELDRADRAGEPYHVVHFDGHGVYDRRIGLGGLCFEDPQDTAKLERRRHATVHTDELGPLLKDYRIPLVFLEACQTAQAEQASESVASELLRIGVASVVAMSHSVLVETARRFVEAFYQVLARGERVGDAMLEGQRRLKEDSFRGHVFSAGELRLEDWFVPVLFQEKDDPRLFRHVPAAAAQTTTREAHEHRMGKLPDPPGPGFVGRSRDLLALERLLRRERFAVVRGQGGEGKTALAAELARWMVRSHQIERAAFVSVETHSTAAAVLDALGRQLVTGYSVATFPDLDQATQPIERELREQSTLLIVDNMESILQPPYVASQTPEALTEDARYELDGILALCGRLLRAGETRLVFTSRETLPEPFDTAGNRRELHRLDREDAVKLIERVLNEAGPGADSPAAAGSAHDAARESIEPLVDAVHGHARTIALLAPTLRRRGVDATSRSLVELMAEMERRFPGSREQSVFASVELSLQRMAEANRERVAVLGVFHGGLDLDLLRTMTQWEQDDVGSLAGDLVDTGLATPGPYNHLTLNPALCPYLRARMEPAEREALQERWVDAMRQYMRFLDQQRSRKTEMAATLTALELANLMALLEEVKNRGDPEATIDVATSLYGLLQNAGRAHLLERVGRIRDEAAAALDETWSHARFEAQRTRIDQQLGGGRMREALQGAQTLLQQARAAGKEAYLGADYDLAGAHFLLARVLEMAGGAEQALPLLDEAQRGFEAIAQRRRNVGAEGMVSACLAERGDCLQDLGRLEEAATTYEAFIRRAGEFRHDRQVAVGKGQLGNVRYRQRLYAEALAAFEEARDRFTELNEPATVAMSWHLIGMAHQALGKAEQAEDAYRKSLGVKVQLGDVAGQGATLGQLGLLYKDVLVRLEEAATFLRQAGEKYIQIGDRAGEGRQRNNLAVVLSKLRRFDEARQEVRRAIECEQGFGHACEPWKTMAVLSEIEKEAEDDAAAAEAGAKALELYLAYRRAGGENHDSDGRIALAVTERLREGDTDRATSALQELAGQAGPAWLQPFVLALQAVVGGSRERELAEHPEFSCNTSAEILLLIETLERAGR